MNHSYYRDKISAYSDGALEAQERELISRHLEECLDCRNLLEKLNQLNSAIEENSALKNDEYFEKLAQRIEQSIAAPQEKVIDVRQFRWNSLWWKISAAAATIVLVGTIGFYQFKDGQEMPGKVLDDLKSDQESVTVKTDSAATDEPTEIQGGHTDNKELDGETAETEAPQMKKEESISLKTVEKVKPVVKDVALRDQATSQTIISQPNETKEKSVLPEAASSEKAEIGDVRVAAETPVIVTSDAVSDSITGEKLSLAQWRSQRDSIQNILGLEKDLAEISTGNRLKSLAAPKVANIAKVEDSVGEFRDLANAWYQIALQTKDVKERDSAIVFLNWYKAKFPNDSSMVNQQLRQITK